MHIIVVMFLCVFSRYFAVFSTLVTIYNGVQRFYYGARIGWGLLLWLRGFFGVDFLGSGFIRAALFGVKSDSGVPLCGGYRGV
jgi:hypothetical protein